MTATCVVFDIRLLNAGQPLHPSAPPVPLQCPPPGHEPFGIAPADTYVDLLCCPVKSVAGGDMLRWCSWTSISEPGAEPGFEDGLFRLVGREIFRAFRYSPQALQIVDPLGDRRQRGVCVVRQLLDTPSQSRVEIS
jgi:hypothetical protein